MKKWNTLRSAQGTRYKWNKRKSEIRIGVGARHAVPGAKYGVGK